MSASRDRDEWDMEDSDDLLPSDSGYGDEKVSERNRDLKQHNGGMSESKPPEKRWTKQFPFSVFFIVGNEFCERFSYYGMRAVLVLFLTHQLGFGDDSATALYHSFIFWCYFLPLLGAIISDSCLGKYGTILSLSVVYAIGNIVVSVSAIPFNNATQANIALAAVGLIIIAVGTGGIKPCVSAFGGDQFTDDQEKFRRYFFSLFYFSINAGSVISTLLTPILRDDINCFGTGECFTLAFGVPAVLMILSLVVFIVGTRFYVILKPKKESARLFLDVPLCISSAIYRRVKHGRISTKTHWLQYASPKFSSTFVEDVRLVLRVLVMFLPLPIFWTLFDQQGSRWTLQAVRMNGELGTVAVKPDQMQALNPILILVLIPIFEFGVYPLAAKCHLLKRPLQRMVVGMVIAGLSFMLAGFVQISVQNADTSISSGHAKIVVINSSPDTVNTRLFDQNFNLSSAETFSRTVGHLSNQTLCVTSDLSADDPCSSGSSLNFSLSSQHIVQLVVYIDEGEPGIVMISEKENLPDGGKSSFRVINTVVSEPYVNFTLYSKRCNCSLESCGGEVLTQQIPFPNVSDTMQVDPKRYYYCARPASEEDSYSVKFQTGGIYTIVLGNTDNEKYSASVVELHAPNSVSLFLQIPMYVLITVGEVLFSISGLEFAYSQAPVSMKALCQAAWLWTVAFGNLFVIIIAEGRIFENQALEFFFFAACIGGLAILFAVMSFFYKYVDLSTHNQLQPEGEGDEVSSDETQALILSHDKGQEQKLGREKNEEGNESEF